MNNQNKERKIMGFIYKITNQTNGKAYIGLTTKERPSDRYSQHRYLSRHPEQERNNSSSAIHAAMCKYGVENFSFEVLEEIEDELLNSREQYWIEHFHTYVKDPKCNGYNLTKGGEGTKGYSRLQSIEERNKRKISNKQFYIDNPEECEKCSKRTKELWKDEAYRKKVTEGIQKFYKEHPDMFKGENNPFYGKKHTPESLEKIKAASKKRQRKIVQLDKDTLEEIKTYNGIKEAEKELGVSHGWLSKAASQNKVAYGYRWKFFEEV